MMDLEVYTIVHCGGERWLNYQTSNGSLTNRCQQGPHRAPVSLPRSSLREERHLYLWTHDRGPECHALMHASLSGLIVPTIAAIEPAQEGQAEHRQPSRQLTVSGSRLQPQALKSALYRLSPSLTSLCLADPRSSSTQQCTQAQNSR